MCNKHDDPAPRNNHREELDSIFRSLKDFIAISSDDEIIKECEKAMDKKFIRFNERKKFINSFMKSKTLEIKIIRDNFKTKVILILFLLIYNEI